MNFPVRPPPETPSRHGFTGADVLRMQAAGLLIEDGKFELIDGEIVDMPSEGEAHLGLMIALNRFLVRAVPDEIIVARLTARSGLRTRTGPNRTSTCFRPP
jgi:hypothetical protein